MSTVGWPVSVDSDDQWDEYEDELEIMEAQRQPSSDSDQVLMICDLKELGSVSEIKNMLQCPVCQGVPIPPIWNCVNGHIACDQCRTQMTSCGVCRDDFLPRGRNYLMEHVVNECMVTCPYLEDGCDATIKGAHVKEHASQCKFGPKIKWVKSGSGAFPPDAVEGGLQDGVKLYVIRATHGGALTPGKLYEYVPAGMPPVIPRASVAWGGRERYKLDYEVLVAAPGSVAWIPSKEGEKIPDAVVGGKSEVGETLYIGRYLYEGELINGKIHPSHHCCYIGVKGMEKASQTYEILVKAKHNNPKNNLEDAGMNDTAIVSASAEVGHSYYS